MSSLTWLIFTWTTIWKDEKWWCDRQWHEIKWTNTLLFTIFFFIIHTCMVTTHWYPTIQKRQQTMSAEPIFQKWFFKSRFTIATYKSYGNDLSLSHDKKLKILIETVVKWSNIFVTKIKCIGHLTWDPGMRSFVIVQAYIPTAVGNTVHQWKFWCCLSV